jgi:hypothetical protein
VIIITEHVMTFEYEAREQVRGLIKQVVNRNLQFSFSLIRGGYIHQEHDTTLDDEEIKALFDLLKEEPYASSLHRIRRANKRREEQLIDLLVETILQRESIFERFDQRVTGPDSRTSLDATSASEAKPERASPSSSSLRAVGYLEGASHIQGQ